MCNDVWCKGQNQQVSERPKLGTADPKCWTDWPSAASCTNTDLTYQDMKGDENTAQSKTQTYGRFKGLPQVCI